MCRNEAIIDEVLSFYQRRAVILKLIWFISLWSAETYINCVTTAK